MSGPLQYDPALAERILSLMADGWTLERICREVPGMPDRNRIDRRWINANVEGFGDRYRAARDRLTVKSCRHCGQPIPPSSQTQKRYCSPECSGRASYYRQVARDGETIRQRRRERHLREQAIREATEEWRKPRPCDQCGDTFTPAPSRRKYCGEACSEAANRPDYGSDEYRAHARAYYASRKDDPAFKAATRKRTRQFHAKNPEKRREYNQSAYERNGVELKRKMREKYAADPMVRLNTAMRSGIYLVLKGKKARRSWLKLVPYTLMELTDHLERQFKRGMSWKNYGTAWHIDHIVPLAAFVFAASDDPEFQACWALSNLRPLASAANRRKKDNRLHLL